MDSMKKYKYMSWKHTTKDILKEEASGVFQRYADILNWRKPCKTGNNMYSNVYQDKTVLVAEHTGFKGLWLAICLTMMEAQVVGQSLK